MKPAPGLRVRACECITPLGTGQETWAALCADRRSLTLLPVLGDEGDLVPLSVFEPMVSAPEPRWWSRLIQFLQPQRGCGWGSARKPVFLASSNFGIDSLYYLHNKGGDASLEDFAPAHKLAARICREMGWGKNIAMCSHACVSASIALGMATDAMHCGAEEALVISFDFLSPFVTGGFHTLKILNGGLPAPYHAGEVGSIALGEGAAYAILSRDGSFEISPQVMWNEMYHFTSNDPSASGFSTLASGVQDYLGDRRPWIKGHGTGTLDAGRLEAVAFSEIFPNAPLVGWKGAIGHTLGSCALIEMAIAWKAMEAGTAPGTVGTRGPVFAPSVALEPFSLHEYDSAIICSNAFGGAHAAFILNQC